MYQRTPLLNFFVERQRVNRQRGNGPEHSQGFQRFGFLIRIVQALVGACLATGDRIFATGRDSVSRIVSRSCGCFCLISGPETQTYCDTSSLAILSFTPILTVRSGPMWRQDLAILSSEGPRGNTCQLRFKQVLTRLGFQGRVSVPSWHLCSISLSREPGVSERRTPWCLLFPRDDKGKRVYTIGLERRTYLRPEKEGFCGGGEHDGGQIFVTKMVL